MNTTLPQPKRRWLRSLAISVLVLCILAAITFWQRSAALQWLLQQSLQHTSLSSPKLSGLLFNFQQAELANIEFGLDTQAGKLLVTLAAIKTDFDLRQATVKSLNIGHATLKLDYQPSDNPEAADQAATPLNLPLEKVTIDKLDIDIATPWGPSHFSGHGELVNTAVEKLVLKLQDARQTVVLELKPDFSDAQLRANVIKVLELNAQFTPAKQTVSLSGNVVSVLNWLHHDALIPATLSKRLEASGINQVIPSLNAVRLDINLLSANNFSSAHGKALLTRDKHDLLVVDLSMPNSKAIAADSHLQISATEAFTLLEPWLPEVSKSWTVASGDLLGTLTLAWQPDQALTGSAQLQLNELAMTAGAAKIQSGNFSLNMPDVTELALELTADVPTLALGKELIASSVQLKAAYQEPALRLDQASLMLFGGSMQLMPDTLLLDKPPLLLSLRLHNIDLSQLLNSLHYPNLSGSGVISGELPLKLSATSLDLQDGSLNGMQPGVLRYVGPVNDNENIAFKALRNLVYQQLQAKVDYRPNGDYHLGLHLEGNNPEVLAGHPLAFNLNISGQLPELLQNGILAGDFERAIMEQATAKPVNIEKPRKPSRQPQSAVKPSKDRSRQ